MMMFLSLVKVSRKKMVSFVAFAAIGHVPRVDRPSCICPASLQIDSQPSLLPSSIAASRLVALRRFEPCDEEPGRARNLLLLAVMPVPWNGVLGRRRSEKNRLMLLLIDRSDQ